MEIPTFGSREHLRRLREMRPVRNAYHVAPRTARDSITRHGLDPSLGEFRSECTPGVYAFLDAGEARWYADYQANESRADRQPMDFDIWTFKVTHEGHCDSGLTSSGDTEHSAVYFDRTIDAGEITLAR